MNYFFGFVLSIGLTSLSYFLGSLFVSHHIAIWQALLIGAIVVSLGALTEAFHAPIGLVVFMPFPIGMLLLYLFLKDTLLVWFITYITTLAIYTVIHIVFSYLFQFHSLIPAWKLS